MAELIQYDEFQDTVLANLKGLLGTHYKDPAFPRMIEKAYEMPDREGGYDCKGEI